MFFVGLPIEILGRDRDGGGMEVSMGVGGGGGYEAT